MGAPGRSNPVRYCGEGGPLRSSSLATASRRKGESNGQKPVEFSEPPAKCTDWPDSLRTRVERVICAQSFSDRGVVSNDVPGAQRDWADAWRPGHIGSTCSTTAPGGQLGAWGRCGSRSCLGHCWRLCGHPALADAAAWHCVTATGQPGSSIYSPAAVTRLASANCSMTAIGDEYKWCCRPEAVLGVVSIGDCFRLIADIPLYRTDDRCHLYQPLGFPFDRRRLSSVDLHLGLTCHITQSFVFGLCQRFEALGR